MKVDVTVPEDYMGDVIGDINSRRGRIEGMDNMQRYGNHSRFRAAGRDVRLRNGSAFQDAGPRSLLHVLRSL